MNDMDGAGYIGPAVGRAGPKRIIDAFPLICRSAGELFIQIITTTNSRLPASQDEDHYTKLWLFSEARGEVGGFFFSIFLVFFSFLCIF